MRNQTKLVSIAAVSLLGVFVGISCRGPARPPQPTAKPFRIGMVTFAGYAPLYLAKEKGFFGDLDVRLERIEEIPTIRAAFTRGDLDAYLATPDIALDIDSKPPGIAVWAIDESAGGDGVVVGAGIDQLADLKGKTVAAEPGLPPNFVLLYLLHKNDLSLNDIQFQDMRTQDAATAFAASAVDAAAIYEPYLSTVTKQRPGSKVVISSAQLPGLIVDLVFVSEATIKTRKADVDRMIDGWNKAVDFIRSNPDEANEIMAKAFNLPVAEFAEIASGVRWLDTQANRTLFKAEGESNNLKATFSTVGDVLRRHRSSVYKTDPQEHLDGSFVP